MVAREFEPGPCREFNIAATTYMQTHNNPAFQFAYLPSYTILTFKLLTNKPHSVNNSGFDILQGDIELYHTLNSGLESINTAVRKRNTDDIYILD